MPSLLKLRQAARLIGVSPGRLYRAIADGRLTAATGGGPGKPTLVSLEAVQTFCRSEGLQIPDETWILERPERSEHAERSMEVSPDLETLAGQYLARVMERQSNYFDVFLKEELSHLVERIVERVVDQVAERLTERLERSERPKRSEHSERSTALSAIASPSKAELVTWLRTLRDSGMSLQHMAEELNARGIQTLSGKGRWQKGTIGKLLAQRNETP
jgi:hypothetical protein